MPFDSIYDRKPSGLPTPDSTKSFWHSQPSALLLGHRSTRELPQSADVVIVGSGMTGASIAHHLLTQGIDGSKDGLRVVMLEAREACWGATGRNGGHCAPQLVQNPRDTSIAHFELSNYHTIASLVDSKNIDCEFVAQPGVLAIYDQDHLDEAEMALLSLKDSAPDLADKLRLIKDKTELQRLRIPTAIAAAETSVAARLWPYKFVARILEDLLTSTALHGTFNLQTLTPVTHLIARWDGAWLVETERGSLFTKKVVLATNAYTSHLVPEFANLIVPCRGQMSALEPLPSVAGSNRLETSFGFIHNTFDDYLVQRSNEDGGQLMYGGGRQEGRSMGVTDDSFIDKRTARWLRTRLIQTLDLPDGKKTKDESQNQCDRCRKRHVKCNITPTSGACQACIRCESKCVLSPRPPPKTAEFTASHEWTGIMGYSRDDHPWVGAVPGKSNLLMAAGFTGHGMPNTWLSGKAVALMLASTEEEAYDVAIRETGLPEAYLVTEERIRRALELEDVEVRDWAAFSKVGKSTSRADRPHSGYA